MEEKNYSKEFNEKSLWERMPEYAARIGRDMIGQALSMYYSLQDADTPAWAKGIIIGALGYLISPLDAIPDAIPVFGLTDDIGVLAAAAAAIAIHIKPEHKTEADKKTSEWFD
jgi:uncharacterized membrane protein YkvA (DUF1232 family)